MGHPENVLLEVDSVLWRLASYMLENGLIRKTKTGKLYNISFKFDTETYAGKYKGSGFSGKIKLADFVDLETGEFI